MGTGYTRNDTANNIADGNVINAADFDGEYDAIEAAFNSSTGHTHDGTSAEGAPITVIGPSQEFVASSSEVKPSTNAGLDLGTSALKFKDLYIDGVAYIDGFGGDILAATDKKIQFRDTALFINSSADGQLDIDADTTIELNSPEVIATDDFRLKSDAAILTFGADNDVSVTHVADTGLDAKAASGFNLKLQTGDTTVENTNTIGKISFNAPDEASGTDAILVGAEIEAAAEATFSSTVNSTALVFKTNDSAAATERMRIKSNGDIVIKGDSYDVTWDASANAFITDSNNDIKLQPHGTGSVAITGALDVDNININGNSITSTDTNGDINITPNGTGKVNISGNFEPSDINLISTDAGSGAGPTLKIDRQSSTPANNDLIGEIKFLGKNDATQEVTYAQILSYISDVTDSAEDGALQLNHIVNGASRVAMSIKPSEVVFNDQHDDVDFRIEGDTNANLFFVDASADAIGIGTNSPASDLHIASASGGTISLEDSDNGFAATTINVENGGRDLDITVPQDTIFTQGSTEAMRILSGGNVGIGTDSPNGALHVKDATDITMNNSVVGQVIIEGNGYTGAIALDTEGMQFYHNSGARSIVFATDETFRMRIDGSGNIGIGTSNTSLTERLEVFDSDLTVKLRDTSSYAEDTGPKINFQANDSAGTIRAVGEVIGAATDSTNEGRLIFNTRNGGSLVETMRLTEDRDAIVTAGGITLTDAGHGVNIDYVGTLPSKAGIFTSSTAHSETAYGDLNVKARSDYGSVYSIGFFTAASAGSPVKRAAIHSGGDWLHPQEERYISDTGIMRFHKSVTVNETATTIFTVTKTSYAYYLMGDLKVMLVDTASPWGVYYREIKLAGRVSTHLAGNNMNMQTAHEENVATLDYTPSFSTAESRTTGSAGGTWEYKLATGSGKGTASAKIIFTGYVAGATLS